MTDEELRNAVAERIDAEHSKVWLTKVNGHRLEFVFSVGAEQLKPVDTLLRDRDFILMGQCVSDAIVEEIRPFFDRYMETAECSDAPSIF